MTAAHQKVTGSTLLPINRVIRLGPNRDPVDLSAYTVKFEIEKDDGTSVVSATQTGVTVHPTQTFTAASTGLATCNGHGVNDGDQIIVATSGTLPSGLAASTRYFAVQVNPNTFGLAATPGGVSVIAGAGTGTHTFYVVGSVQYKLQASLAAGNYRGWFTLNSGSEPECVPNDSLGIPIISVSEGN